ncbi:putative membrane protein [[Clostridium] cellulosi]|uniref:Putative membrane protein n=1 Tax=[Clostridium] cellulosi TaxID=29343 RepID=A0A078KRI8_9FIRM|nr:putative membrane protein [[Clostridium] cellulosi]
MSSEVYISPVVAGPSPDISNDTNKCVVGQNCSTGFATIVIVGGGVLVAVAVYCPPAVVVATVAT